MPIATLLRPTVFLTALLLTTNSVALAKGQAAGTGTPLQRGDSILLLASPLFTDDDLGHAYARDLDGLRSRRVVDDALEIRTGGETRTWFQKQDDEFRLNVSGTATGMLNDPVPVGNRRSAQLVMYKIESVSSLPKSTKPPVPAELAEDDALLLSEIHYGWSFTVIIVGTTRTLTTDVYDELQHRVEAGQPIEPVLQANNLAAVTSSRGLGFGYRTPRPDRLPVSWAAVEQRYDLAEPEPVLAQYTLLREIQPKPIRFSDGN